jgi:hypothetical protein
MCLCVYCKIRGTMNKRRYMNAPSVERVMLRVGPMFGENSRGAVSETCLGRHSGGPVADHGTESHTGLLFVQKALLAFCT